MKPKILIVDDEPDCLFLLRDFLSDIEVEVIEACNGVEAWDILQKSYTEIDLVLLDRMMPELDGMGVMAKVTAHPEVSKIPIIMQTAAASPVQMQSGIDAGVYCYLLKPYDDEKLIALVTKALAENPISDRKLKQA